MIVTPQIADTNLLFNAIQSSTTTEELLSQEGEWRISDKIKRAYQQTLQNYSQHLEERELNQLTTAAGNTGLAGVTADKLITFSPLWKIQQISSQNCPKKGMILDL